MKITKNLILYLAVLIYFMPFILSMSLPFSSWDWLMVPDYQLQGHVYSWRSIPSNLYFSLFEDTVQFRPVSTFIVNVQYLVFGGEFWLWYLVKWIIFAACIFCLFDFIFLITNSIWAGLSATIYFLLHPMPFVLDVLSQDGYVVFFGLMALRFYQKFIFKNESIDYCGSKFIKYFFLVLLATFSKEVGIAYLLVVIMLLLTETTFEDLKKNFWKFSLFLAIFFLDLYKLIHTSHPSSHLGLLLNGDLEKFMTGFGGSFLNLLGYLLPTSPYQLLTGVTLIILIVGAINVFKKMRQLVPLFLFSLLGLFASLIVIAFAYSCPKYMPVPVMFFALLIGVSISTFDRPISYVNRILILFFIFIVILSSPPKIYSEWLGLMQTNYEMADIINFIEVKESEGYSAVWVDAGLEKDLPHEKGATLEKFFRKSCTEWYGYDQPMNFYPINQSQKILSGKVVILTSLPVNEIAKGALSFAGVNDLSHISDVFIYQRERYGSFENVTSLLKKFDQLMGVSLRDPIDCQLPQPSRFGKNFINPMHDLVYFPYAAGPHFLYLVDSTKRFDKDRKLVVREIPPLRRYGALAR